MGVWMQLDPQEIKAQDNAEWLGRAVALRTGETAAVTVERTDGSTDPWTVTLWRDDPGAVGVQRLRQLRVRGGMLAFQVEGVEQFRVGIKTDGAPPLTVSVQTRVESVFNQLDSALGVPFNLGPSPEEFEQLLREIEGLT